MRKKRSYGLNVCSGSRREPDASTETCRKQAEVFAGDTEIWLSGHGKAYWDNHARGPEQYLVIWQMTLMRNTNE